MNKKLQLQHKDFTGNRWHVVYYCDLGQGFFKDYAGLVYVGSATPAEFRSFLVGWVKRNSVGIQPTTYLFKGDLTKYD